MKLYIRLLIVAIMLSLAVGSLAATSSGRVTVPKGTIVTLVFDQSLKSQTAKAGDRVKLHVRDNVKVGNRTVISRGTHVTGVLTEVKHKQRWGVNAKILIALRPVMSTYGQYITLDHRQSGKQFGGTKSEQAAGASIGGAVLLGPVGLVGGYFVTGKRVVIKPGDLLPTQVANTIVLHR
jgi:hypothetical protein